MTKTFDGIVSGNGQAGPAVAARRGEFGLRAASTLLATSALLFAPAAPVAAQAGSRPSGPPAEIGYIDIGDGLSLRRSITRAAAPKGTVLLLHGFPETLHAWTRITPALDEDFEVHAFDWPGFGQSSRPPAERFAYAPRDYAEVLKRYLAASGIDRSTLVIYATDIGALPALLLALEQPAAAKAIVVGDFAPFDRPQYMYPSLQSLKTKSSADAIHVQMNRTRDEILANAFTRGLPADRRYDVPSELAEDMARAWRDDGPTPADAFFHYYTHFTRDQNYLEANLARLETPIEVVWGELDIYIGQAMGAEFARRTGSALRVLDGIGHYPHLQSPQRAIDELRASFARYLHSPPGRFK